LSESVKQLRFQPIEAFLDIDQDNSVLIDASCSGLKEMNLSFSIQAPPNTLCIWHKI